MAKRPKKRKSAAALRPQRPTPGRSRKSPGSDDEKKSAAVLKRELDEARQQLSEALAQQTATSDVLQVISSSPGELELVFNSMLENAVRICGAKFGNLWLRESEGYRIAATHGAPLEYREYFARRPVVVPDPRSGLGQIERTKQPVHIEDLQAADSFKLSLIHI